MRGGRTPHRWQRSCVVVAIRDRRRRGWVLYPHGMASLGVLIGDDDAHTLAARIGGPT